MGSNADMNSNKKVLNDFLDKHNAKDKYWTNVADQKNENTVRILLGKDHLEPCLIDAMGVWGMTSESREFWSGLDLEWEHHIRAVIRKI